MKIFGSQPHRPNLVLHCRRAHQHLQEFLDRLKIRIGFKILVQTYHRSLELRRTIMHHPSAVLHYQILGNYQHFQKPKPNLNNRILCDSTTKCFKKLLLRLIWFRSVNARAEAQRQGSSAARRPAVLNRRIHLQNLHNLKIYHKNACFSCVLS